MLEYIYKFTVLFLGLFLNVTSYAPSRLLIQIAELALMRSLCIDAIRTAEALHLLKLSISIIFLVFSLFWKSK